MDDAYLCTYLRCTPVIGRVGAWVRTTVGARDDLVGTARRISFIGFIPLRKQEEGNARSPTGQRQQRSPVHQAINKQTGIAGLGRLESGVSQLASQPKHPFQRRSLAIAKNDA